MVDRLTSLILSTLRGQRGQDMVEYALITGAISIAIALVLLILSPAFGIWSGNVASCVSDPLSNCPTIFG